MIRKTIEEIKAEYPNPGSMHNRVVNRNYCVGGAILKACKIHTIGHPIVKVLADGLQMINTELPECCAHSYAYNIIEANDAHRYEKAWAIAEEAFNYKENE